MPTFVYMTACDGCGHCVDICPSDIMHIDPTTTQLTLNQIFAGNVTMRKSLPTERNRRPRILRFCADGAQGEGVERARKRHNILAPEIS